MFRIRDPCSETLAAEVPDVQERMLHLRTELCASHRLVTPKKAKRLERSWAEVFRNEALPLIDEPSALLPCTA